MKKKSRKSKKVQKIKYYKSIEEMNKDFHKTTLMLKKFLKDEYGITI